jgi:hypothetical protein
MPLPWLPARDDLQCAGPMTVTESLPGADAVGLYVDHPVFLQPDGTVRAWSITMILADHSGTSAQDPRRLSRAVERGDLVRIRPGVYAERAGWNDAYPMNRYMATVLAVAASRRRHAAVFCRETALALHGINLWSLPREINVRSERPGSTGIRKPVTVPGAKYAPFVERYRLRPHAWRSHQGVGRHGACSEELVLAGIRMRVESLDLVLADTIPIMDPAEAATVLDALHAGRPAGLKNQRATHAAPWSKGGLLGLQELCTSAAARGRFLARAEFATDETESPGESVSRVMIRDLGFTHPDMQHRVHDGDGELLGITDFWWKDAATVGEFDGLAKYLGRRSYSGLSPEMVIAEERRREDAICDQGLQMVRWLTEDLRNPARLEAKLRRAGVPRRGDRNVRSGWTSP